jgi:hypothetical protein
MLEFTMEEEKEFGKELLGVASRSSDSHLREVHSRGRAMDLFGPLDKRTRIAGRRDKRRD